jgi:hypothetical protein
MGCFGKFQPKMPEASIRTVVVRSPDGTVYDLGHLLASLADLEQRYARNLEARLRYLTSRMDLPMVEVILELEAIAIAQQAAALEMEFAEAMPDLAASLFAGFNIVSASAGTAPSARDNDGDVVLVFGFTPPAESPKSAPKKSHQRSFRPRGGLLPARRTRRILNTQLGGATSGSSRRDAYLHR